MKQSGLAMCFTLVLAVTSVTQAAELNYDYLDVSATDIQLVNNGPEYDGYSLDFSYGLGRHFSILVGFDNVKAEDNDWENRIKTKSFGFGYHNSITNTIDFVAEYTKQKIRDTETEVIGNTITQWRYHDRGDTTKLGLRGIAFDNLEWDALAVRKTVRGEGIDFDETGIELGVRYRLLPKFSVGFGVATIEDFEQTSVNVRYQF
jgi:hypothetical protein